MTDINIDGIVTWLSNWFQETLVSGSNLKTINNQSLLGSGNISIGGSGTVDTSLSITSENPVQNKAIAQKFNSNRLLNSYQTTSTSTTSAITTTISSNYTFGNGSIFVLRNNRVSANDDNATLTITYYDDGVSTTTSAMPIYYSDGATRIKANTLIQGGYYIMQYNSASNGSIILLNIEPPNDTGWQDISFNTGWTQYDSTTYPCQYRKIGKLVEIRGLAKPSSTQSTSPFNIATLPTGYRPSSPVFTYRNGFANYHFVLTIDTNGDMKIDRYYNGNTSQSSATTSQMFTLNCMYMVD